MAFLSRSVSWFRILRFRHQLSLTLRTISHRRLGSRVKLLTVGITNKSTCSTASITTLGCLCLARRNRMEQLPGLKFSKSASSLGTISN
ncbi:hypothetical protein P167DRAFT_352455 [Morchella conica CCBAS932]|uniref:Uncharacterized protein n=1 Tax=Morchella conica CCBAS932 TaxID=1392247 RepID=A0A3N4L027_9PEZI|nr:hypothetical protein P167DRAFT_352455 [Morchella conica CCBAS932]